MFMNKKIAAMEQRMEQKLEKRLREAARYQGEHVGHLFNDMNAKLRDQEAAIAEQRKKIVARHFAIERALATPGIEGHEDVLRAAQAYETFLLGEGEKADS